jgi:hypothetical protein
MSGCCCCPDYNRQYTADDEPIYPNLCTCICHTADE